MINNPTRVTLKIATIINDIFTNEYENENEYMTGILTTDISDLYPIIRIAACKNIRNDESHKLIRLINGRNLEKYINGIQRHDWLHVNHYESYQAAFT